MTLLRFTMDVAALCAVHTACYKEGPDMIVMRGPEALHEIECPDIHYPNFGNDNIVKWRKAGLQIAELNGLDLEFNQLEVLAHECSHARGNTH